MKNKLKIIECVPNFSEGKNKEIIDSISNIIKNRSNVTLLDVDSGKDTNRTVMTFVGEPDDVIDCAYAVIKKASDLINMNHHTGTHARMGATDVCPLIPIKNVSMEECVKYSKILGERVGKGLNIPIFLYENSSNNILRKNLANIRKGEFEGMSKKLKRKKWKPDYGPKVIHKTAGVTAIGARQFLLAYNININTIDKKIATDIALDIREAGRAKRDKNNKIKRDKNGKIIKIPGSLKCTKAVGWYLEEFKTAQISMNLVDYNVTSLEDAFEEVRVQARKRGFRVTGSEIVGLIPKEALFNAGLFYLKKQNKSIGIPTNDILNVAIKSLGLNDLYDFDIDNKIIEYQVTAKHGKLVKLKLYEFIDELSTNSPAPGGGSVSALAGALSVSLISMVANLSLKKNNFESMEKISYEAQNIKNNLVKLIDDDTDSFNNLMKTFKMPKKTNEQNAIRNISIEEATKTATEIPMEILKLCLLSMKLAVKVAERGNKSTLSDSGVAGEMAIAGCRGAVMNVNINLKTIKDKQFIKQTKYNVDKYLAQINENKKTMHNLFKKNIV